MTATRLAFPLAGDAFIADHRRALYHPASTSLILADLHLEKASFFASRGQLLPPYDTRATLDRLAGLIHDHQPRRVIALGDSFHDRGAGARLDPDDRATLAALAEGRQWLWLTGNHDPDLPPGLPGEPAPDDLTLGSLALVHQPPAVDLGNNRLWLAGHLHPKARVPTAQGMIGGRCFVTDGQRLILPAFGALTGGLDVLDPAIAGLFPAGFDILMIGPAAVHRIAGHRLRRR